MPEESLRRDEAPGLETEEEIEKFLEASRQCNDPDVMRDALETVARIRQNIVDYAFPRRTIQVAEHIDVDDPASIAKWCAELNLTEEKLRNAVDAIGAMPAAVRFYVRGDPALRKEVTAEMRAAFALKQEGRTQRRESAQAARRLREKPKGDRI
jgi:hypothetical protein